MQQGKLLRLLYIYVIVNKCYYFVSLKLELDSSWPSQEVCFIKNVEDFEAKLKQAGGQLVVLDFFAEWCGLCKTIAPKFEAKLKQAGDQLVVLDFFAEWCGPCKEIAPKFEEFAIKYTHVIFYKVGVDDAGDVAEKCNIVSMPTFVFFKNGQQVGKIIGGSIS
ncbi:uncharacterized protein [Scyliorhinus torazame]|uniref:uncharacterized protein n=1 Tax=Scyliorhinus torazame TaxID=75743 RepID=UPI003B5C6E21